MRHILHLSIEKDFILEMIYISNNNKITQRFIKVLNINQTSVVAYCFYRRKVRTFKLANILSIQPSRRSVA